MSSEQQVQVDIEAYYPVCCLRHNHNDSPRRYYRPLRHGPRLLEITRDESQWSHRLVHKMMINWEGPFGRLYQLEGGLGLSRSPWFFPNTLYAAIASEWRRTMYLTTFELLEAIETPYSIRSSGLRHNINALDTSSSKISKRGITYLRQQV